MWVIGGNSNSKRNYNRTLPVVPFRFQFLFSMFELHHCLYNIYCYFTDKVFRLLWLLLCYFRYISFNLCVGTGRLLNAMINLLGIVFVIMRRLSISVYVYALKWNENVRGWNEYKSWLKIWSVDWLKKWKIYRSLACQSMNDLFLQWFELHFFFEQSCRSVRQFKNM